MILVVEKLLKFITESLGTQLDFDRGMIMLADKEKKRLVLHCRIRLQSKSLKTS